jgi:hypothetical protein
MSSENNLLEKTKEALKNKSVTLASNAAAQVKKKLLHEIESNTCYNKKVVSCVKTCQEELSVSIEEKQVIVTDKSAKYDSQDQTVEFENVSSNNNKNKKNKLVKEIVKKAINVVEAAEATLQNDKKEKMHSKEDCPNENNENDHQNEIISDAKSMANLTMSTGTTSEDLDGVRVKVLEDYSSSSFSNQDDNDNDDDWCKKEDTVPLGLEPRHIRDVEIKKPCDEKEPSIIRLLSDKFKGRSNSFIFNKSRF